MSEWNGVPITPEKDGWHWLRHRDASFCTPMEWRHPGGWVANNIPLLPNEVQRFIIGCCEYLGPCLTPEENAAQAARIAQLEGLAYGLMLAMSASGHDFTDILREARAALEGGKDEDL